MSLCCRWTPSPTHLDPAAIGREEVRALQGSLPSNQQTTGQQVNVSIFHPPNHQLLHKV
jgi:hypothetical protein